MLGSDFVRLSSELFCIWCICPTWKCCDGRCYIAPTKFLCAAKTLSTNCFIDCIMPENFSLKITVGDTSIEGSAMNPESLALMMQDAIIKIQEIKKARAS